MADGKDPTKHSSSLNEGGCACGDIRFRITGPSLMALNCHCVDCRRASGSAFASVFAVNEAHFQIRHGHPKAFETTSTTGGVVVRSFCGRCGSPLFGRSSNKSDLVVVHASTLDDSSEHSPQISIFTRDLPPWAIPRADLPSFAEGPL